MSEVKGSKKAIITGLVVLAVLVPAGIWKLNADKTDSTKTNTAQNLPETVPTEAPKTEYVTYQGVDGKTALELLKGQANVQTESSEYGEFVKSINGNDGGGSKYWTFLVDGKEASVGAGTYLTKNGEKIEWKLQ